VKIVLDADGSLAGDLRPGMSGLPTIETRTRDRVAQTRRDPATLSRGPRLRRSGMSKCLSHGGWHPARQSRAGPTGEPHHLGRILAGMIGAFMAILNIQITNASLLDIEGGIGTGVDNGAWISPPT